MKFAEQLKEVKKQYAEYGQPRHNPILSNKLDSRFEGIGDFDYAQIYFKALRLGLYTDYRSRPFQYLPNIEISDPKFEQLNWTEQTYDFENNACGNGLHAWRTFDKATRFYTADDYVVYTCIVKDIVAADYEKVRGRAIILLDLIYVHCPSMVKGVEFMTALNAPDELMMTYDQQRQRFTELNNEIEITNDFYLPQIQELEQQIAPLRRELRTKVLAIEQQKTAIEDFMSSSQHIVDAIWIKKQYESHTTVLARYHQIVSGVLDILYAGWKHDWSSDEKGLIGSPNILLQNFAMYLNIPLTVPNKYCPTIDRFDRYTETLVCTLFRYPDNSQFINPLTSKPLYTYEEFHERRSRDKSNIMFTSWDEERTAIPTLLFVIYLFVRELREREKRICRAAHRIEKNLESNKHYYGYNTDSTREKSVLMLLFVKTLATTIMAIRSYVEQQPEWNTRFAAFCAEQYIMLSANGNSKWKSNSGLFSKRLDHNLFWKNVAIIRHYAYPSEE